jgi:hypothetical protein
MSVYVTFAEAEKHAVALPFWAALKREIDVVETRADPVRQS